MKETVNFEHITIMKSIRRDIKNLSLCRGTALIMCIMVCIALTAGYTSYAVAEENTYYSVQTGSFTKDITAKKQLNALQKSLSPVEPAFIRIEKSGNYYVVRLGRFKNYAAASVYLQSRKEQLNGAIIVKTNNHAGRIVMQNNIAPSDAVPTRQGTSVPAEQIILAGNTAGNPEQETVDYATKDYKANDKNHIHDKKRSHVKGRFYLSDYYSHDSHNFDFHVLSARVKIYQRENDDNQYFFKFDARARKKVSDNDVHSDIPEYKFYEAWLGYKFTELNIDLIAGRQQIHEMYNTSVDGINTRFWIKDDMGIGVFTGLAPDKYDYSFNEKFRTVGMYGFMDRDRYKLRIGYERLYYDGTTDREYFSVKMFSTPTEQTRLNVLSSASINQLTKSIDIDSLSAALIHKYSRDLRCNLFFNYYRVIRYFESSKKFIAQNGADDSYFIDPNAQSRIGLRVNYRINRDLTLYTSLAYQKREVDDKHATRFTGGFRKYDLYGYDISGRYTRINNFTSQSNEFNVEVSRLLFDTLDLSVYASHEQEELDIENGFTAGLLTYGASAYWSINKHYFASMFLERYDEDDYDNISIFTQAGYRF